MTEAEWVQLADAYAGLKHPPTFNARKRRLLDCACVRHVFPFMTHPYFLNVAVTLLKGVEASEALADGEITWEDMKANARREVTKCMRALRPALKTHFCRYAAEAAFETTEREAKNKGMLSATAAMGYRAREYHSGRLEEAREQVKLLHDIFGNPFRPVAFDPSWRTSTVAALAEQMYGSRDFAPLPVLADALQDAGCEHEAILAHCRGDGPHVRGCWVVDLILGKS